MTHKNNDLSPELERYLALCKRAYDRMVATGEWPWLDSPDFEKMVESENNSDEI